MTDNGETKPEKIKRTEPALFVATQTTIPILTQIMAGFSLAIIGIAANASWSEPLCLPFQMNTKSICLIMVGVSTLLFLFATEACVKSQSWDYFALSSERRTFYNLPEGAYIKKCMDESERWHKVAVWVYRVGVVLMILGVAFLFWPVSRTTAIVMGLYLPIAVILALILKGRTTRILND